MVRVHTPYQNLVLDFDAIISYNESSRQRKAFKMRPVDQVVADYEKATAAVKQAQVVQSKFREELKEIHNAVASFLGRSEVKPRDLEAGIAADYRG